MNLGGKWDPNSFPVVSWCQPWPYVAQLRDTLTMAKSPPKSPLSHSNQNSTSTWNIRCILHIIINIPLKNQVRIFLQFWEMGNELICIVVEDDLLVVTFSSISGTSTDRPINITFKINFITYCSHINKYQLFSVRKNIPLRFFVVTNDNLEQEWECCWWRCSCDVFFKDDHNTEATINSKKARQRRDTYKDTMDAMLYQRKISSKQTASWWPHGTDFEWKSCGAQAMVSLYLLISFY